MKKVMLVLSVLTLVLSVELSWSTGPASTQPDPQSSGTSPSSGFNPPLPGTPAAVQPPPVGWTSLRGTVQSINLASETLQIKDDTGSLIQVPIDRQVSIQRNGKEVKPSLVQSGDFVALTKTR